MMRCRLWCALCLHIALVCNFHIPAAWHGTGFYGERQIVKLKRRSDPSTGLGADNRMYYEPSAQRRIRFYWTRLKESSVVRVPLLPESSEWSTGIVFGVRGKRGDPSCRGGGRSCVLPLWSEGFQRRFSSVLTFKKPLYRRIYWMSQCRR